MSSELMESSDEDSNLLEECSCSLKKLICGCTQSFNFTTGGRASDIFPNLHVKDIGPLSFPLLPEQANKLRDKCSRSTSDFDNKGIDTIENIFELKPEDICIQNKYWNGHFMKDLIAEIACNFGLRKNLIQPELRKLLFVDQDGCMVGGNVDKQERIKDKNIGSLVIFLPSIFEGGELCVALNEKDSVCFSFDNGSEDRIHYVALLKDCYYGFAQIISGGCTCLVYNLEYFYGIPARISQIDGYARRVAEILNPIGSKVNRLIAILHPKKLESKLCFENLLYPSMSKVELLKKACEIANPPWHAYLVTLQGVRSIYHKNETPCEKEFGVLGESYPVNEEPLGDSTPLHRISEMIDLKSKKIQRDEIYLKAGTKSLIGDCDMDSPDLSDDDNEVIEDKYDSIRKETFKKEHYAILLVPDEKNWNTRGRGCFSDLCKAIYTKLKQKETSKRKNALKVNTSDVSQLIELALNLWSKPLYHKSETTKIEKSLSLFLKCLLLHGDKNFIEKYFRQLINDDLDYEFRFPTDKEFYLTLVSIVDQFGIDVITAPILTTEYTAEGNGYLEFLAFIAGEFHDQQIWDLFQTEISKWTENHHYVFRSNAAALLTGCVTNQSLMVNKSPKTQIEKDISIFVQVLMEIGIEGLEDWLSTGPQYTNWTIGVFESFYHTAYYIDRLDLLNQVWQMMQNGIEYDYYEMIVSEIYIIINRKFGSCFTWKAPLLDRFNRSQIP